MKVGVVVTYYDESGIVAASTAEIRRVFPDSYVVCIHSDDGSEPVDCDQYIKLTNLAGTVDNARLPARSICRNYSAGFTTLYASGQEFDLIVAFTGDTLIRDASSFSRRAAEMSARNWHAMISQPIHQRQHAATDSVPQQMIPHGRVQHPDTHDFICCLYFVNGGWGRDTRAFADIKVVNDFCSEHCLGDEITRALGGEVFGDRVGRLNSAMPHNCYDYSDGIMWHARSGGRPGR